MKRNRGERRYEPDVPLRIFTVGVALAAVFAAQHVKDNIDEGLSQPPCVVAVDSDDSLQTLSEEVTAAGDRHHTKGDVYDTNAELVTEAQRPRFDEHGDIRLYLGDRVVFLFVGETACDTVQAVHNQAPELVPALRLFTPDVIFSANREPVAS